MLALLAWQLLLPIAASAYSVRVRWGASADPAIAGYHLYVRENDAEYGAPRSIDPMLDADGNLTAVLSDLDLERTYVFALSAYSADGVESPRSNERTIGYADAAAVVDSDGDGLTDAEEDVNLNGIRDPGETDRLVADTDGDGVPDGIERDRGSDPLVADAGACAAIPFADFGFNRRGMTDVSWDDAIDDTALHAVQTSRGVLKFLASYPARGAAALTAPVLVTAIRSTQRFRVEVQVRSTTGKRYTMRYEGNGGADRITRHAMTLTLGDEFAGGDYRPFARDLAADLAVIDPAAVLATVSTVRVRGQYDMRQLRVCD
ncbi:MAG TPA: hypothetical protein VGK30_09120 [Candidatus Binatia bacterium]|jgi:hypothetical protein